MTPATARTLRVVKDQDHPARADLDQVAEFAETLSDEYLLCRRLGHVWGPFQARVNARTMAIHEVLRCRRCKTKKVMDTLRGYIESSHYNHPEGYLNKGTGANTREGRAIIRLASQLRGNVVYVDDEGNEVPPPRGTLKETKAVAAKRRAAKKTAGTSRKAAPRKRRT
jgi:hypothetical protein